MCSSNNGDCFCGEAESCRCVYNNGICNCGSAQDCTCYHNNGACFCPEAADSSCDCSHSNGQCSSVEDYSRSNSSNSLREYRLFIILGSFLGGCLVLFCCVLGVVLVVSRSQRAQARRLPDERSGVALYEAQQTPYGLQPIPFGATANRAAAVQPPTATPVNQINLPVATPVTLPVATPVQAPVATPVVVSMPPTYAAGPSNPYGQQQHVPVTMGVALYEEDKANTSYNAKI